MEEDQGATLANRHLLVEARGQGSLPVAQRRLDGLGLLDTRSIEGRRQRGRAPIARIEDQQPLVGEERSQRRGEGGR